MMETTWRGTVLLEGERVVPVGEALTVQAGTRVLAGPGARLRVEGALAVQGTAEGGDVSFSGDGAAWAGLVVAGRGRAELTRVRIKGAETALRCEDEGRADLSRCEVLEAKHVGLLVRGRGRLRACDGLIALSETNVTLQDEGQAELLRCRLLLGELCGANAMMSSRATIHDCRFEANHTALSLRDRAAADVRGSVFRGHHVGVYARGEVKLNVVGNRFQDNRQEIELVEDAWISASLAGAGA